LDAAAIDFELGLTWSARADAAGLPREVAPHAGEAGEEVLELGEFDLQATFAGARPARENIENQLGAIDHLTVREFLEIAALRGGKLVIENHGGRVFFPRGFGDFTGLAFADVKRWASRISRARVRADSGWGIAVKSSEGKLNCVRHQVNWRFA